MLLTKDTKKKLEELDQLLAEAEAFRVRNQTEESDKEESENGIETVDRTESEIRIEKTKNNESENQAARANMDRLKKETGNACRKLLNAMNVPGFIWKNRDTFCRPIEKKLNSYFLTRKQKQFSQRLQYDDRYYGGIFASRTRITSDTFGQFIDSFLDTSGQLDRQIFQEAMGSKALHKYLLDVLKKEWPEDTETILTVFRKADQLFSLRAEDAFVKTLKHKGIKSQIRDYICSTYNGQKIENLLAKNPYYRKMYKVYRDAKMRELRIRQGLLDSIPATYPELFPLARQKQRHFILHIGPTNSGKSYEAIEALKQADTGIYLAPLRLLAYEKYEELNEAGCYCSLKTGEEEITVPGATLQSSTVEILDFSKEYEVAVIDEAQMVSDSQRGSGWTFALLGINADIVHVCLAPEAENVVKDIIRACGDTFEVHRHERLVPLKYEAAKKQIYPNRVEPGDALIVFSRRDVHAVAAELQHKNYKCSVIYGNLPYDVRRNEVRRYQNGETELVVATDAIGMGVNLPIRRIVFLELDKFDGKERRNLLPQEIKQIAGRAGRFGIFDEGFVTANEGGKLVKSALQTELPQIKTARIGFPYTLLGVEGKASELMQKWCEIRPKPGFEVADLSREIQLAMELEAECEDKQLIYEFVMFPYDEKNSVIKEIWLELFRMEKNGELWDYLEYLPVLPVESDDLSELEQSFKICDLLYHYAEKFTDKSEQPVILKRKNEISAVIMKKLEKEKLERRKCRACGRPLPFLYPHGICQSCHDRLHGHVRRRVNGHVRKRS